MVILSFYLMSQSDKEVGRSLIATKIRRYLSVYKPLKKISWGSTHGQTLSINLL